MERNERKLLWGLEAAEKGQENVDITLGSKKRTKKVYRRIFWRVRDDFIEQAAR